MSEYRTGYRAGRRDERADVVRWLLSEAETWERIGNQQAARALVKAANAVLANKHT